MSLTTTTAAAAHPAPVPVRVFLDNIIFLDLDTISVTIYPVSVLEASRLGCCLACPPPPPPVGGPQSRLWYPGWAPAPPPAPGLWSTSPRGLGLASGPRGADTDIHWHAHTATLLPRLTSATSRLLHNRCQGMMSRDDAMCHTCCHASGQWCTALAAPRVSPSVTSATSSARARPGPRPMLVLSPGVTWRVTRLVTTVTIVTPCHTPRCGLMTTWQCTVTAACTTLTLTTSSSRPAPAGLTPTPTCSAAWWLTWLWMWRKYPELGKIWTDTFQIFSSIVQEF